MAGLPTMLPDVSRQEEMNSLSCLLRTFLPDQQDFSFTQNTQQFLQRIESHEYSQVNSTERMMGLSEVAKRLIDDESKYHNSSNEAKQSKQSYSSSSDKGQEESDGDSDATIDLVMPAQDNSSNCEMYGSNSLIPQKNYICFVCDCNFNSNEDYKNHMVNLCGNHSSHYRCIDCGNSFSNRSSLHSHEKLAPYELWVDKEMQKKPLYLQNYNSSSCSSGKLSTDVPEPSADEKESMYLCNSCGKPVRKFRHFLDHVYSHGVEKPFRCALCSDSFESTCMLRFHIDTQHSQILPFQCKQCFRRFKLKCSLSTHSKFCKMDRSTLKYAEEIQFIDHLNQQRKFQGGGEDGLSQFSCPVCTVMFDSPEELHIHLLKHDETKPFHCDKCGQGFSSKLGHDKHMALHDKEIVFTCEICGVELVTRSGYKAHLRGHKNIETLQAQAGLTSPSTALNASGSCSTEELVDKLYNDQFKVKKEILSDDETGVNEHTLKSPVKKKVIPSYPCPMCDKMFFTGGAKFQDHVRKEHVDAPLEECDICKKKFYGKHNLTRHKGIHRLYSQSFPCEECGRVFRKKYALEVHKKMHSFKKFVKCDICDQEFRFVSEVEKHKHTKHKYDRTLNIYKCNICGQKFPVLSHLSVHCYYHNVPDAKAFECDLCKLCFKTATELKQHIYQKHDHLMKVNADNEKILVPSRGMSIPGYDAADFKPEMDDVKEDVSKDKPKGKALPKSNNLMSARILTASGGMTAAAANKLACTTELLKGKDGESSMMRMVPSMDSDEEDARPEAEYSVQTGVDAYNMATRQNMLQSRFLKRFSCEVCTKTFASKSDLKTHLRTHSGETPFKCDYCERSFKQRGHRKLHIQVAHTKEMPYKCEECGSAFPTRYRYQIHVKRHGGIKEYQCAYCQKEFYTKGKMNEHKKNRHKEQWKEEQKAVGTLFE